MRFSERIWRPTLKDLVAELAPARYLTRVLTSAANAVVASQLPDIPADKILHATHLYVQATAGAAQTVTSISVAYNDATLNDIGVVVAAFALPPGSTAALWVLDRHIELMITADDIFRVQCAFNAGVAANGVLLSVHGVLVPRGNWIT